MMEDIGPGDYTTLSTIPASATGSAHLHVKENGILAGIEAAKFVFEKIDSDLQLEILKKDGSKITTGDTAFTVSGSVRSILIAERLVLNIMQRMSGIATKTFKLASQISDLPCTLLDTRKTTPGFRYFEKWAVRIGGGENHRFGLFDMIMIKDNHIDYAGGITEAVKKVREYLGDNHLNLKIEVETRNLKEVNEALDCGGIDRIMLDNFTPELMKEAISIINRRVETEASGGITEETIRSYAETGVDFISLGTLTHHIKSLDLSLKAV